MDVTTSVLFKQSLVLKADQVCFLNIHFNPKTNFLFVEKKIKGRVVTGNLPDRHVFGGKSEIQAYCLLLTCCCLNTYDFF